MAAGAEAELELLVDLRCLSCGCGVLNKAFSDKGLSSSKSAKLSKQSSLREWRILESDFGLQNVRAHTDLDTP